MRCSLRKKIWLLIGVMLAPTILVGWLALLFSEGMAEKLQDAIRQEKKDVLAATRLQNLIHRAIMPPNDYLATGDPSEAIRFEGLAVQVDAGFDGFSRTSQNDQRKRDLVQEAMGHWIAARHAARALFDFSKPIGNPEAARFMTRMDYLAGNAVESLGELFSINQRERENDLAAADESIRQMKNRTVLVIVSGLGIASYLTFLLIRNIVVPLGRLTEGINQLGKGDLNCSIRIATGDELESLAVEFNRMAAALRENHKALRYLAAHDGLTGLINHNEFYLRLTEECSRSARHKRPMTLLMVDVDHFKKFNDTYGHQRGDLVLKLIAKTLKTSLRQSDLVARYGGEEFAILLPETPLQEGLALASRIQKSFADRGDALTGVVGLMITVSIGAAAYPVDATTPDKLVQVADQMLYKAKASGRNRICAPGEGLEHSV